MSLTDVTLSGGVWGLGDGEAFEKFFVKFGEVGGFDTDDQAVVQILYAVVIIRFFVIDDPCENGFLFRLLRY